MPQATKIMNFVITNFSNHQFKFSDIRFCLYQWRKGRVCVLPSDFAHLKASLPEEHGDMWLTDNSNPNNKYLKWF